MAARRALFGVNGAAALALCTGGWAAVELSQRPLSPPLSRQPWHALPIDTVLAQLRSSPGGLDARTARHRRRVDVEMRPPTPNLARAVVEELANPLTPILAAGAALSAAVGSLADAGLFAGVGAASAVLGGVQRTITDRAVADLLARSATTGRVLRDGQQVTLPADQLVSGDVITVGSGDAVPADCRILDAAGLPVDCRGSARWSATLGPSKRSAGSTSCASTRPAR